MLVSAITGWPVLLACAVAFAVLLYLHSSRRRITRLGNHTHFSHAVIHGGTAYLAGVTAQADGKGLTVSRSRRAGRSLSSSSGWRWQMPLAEVLDQARAAFPRRGKPQQRNICLCHLTRTRVIARAQNKKRTCAGSARQASYAWTATHR